jgi:hypothetical protein
MSASIAVRYGSQPTSSSGVKNTQIGGSGPRSASARSAKITTTRPAFMS